jgi:hypothetical protein
MRRPAQLAVARMFWAHLGHSNWNSFMGSGFASEHGRLAAPRQSRGSGRVVLAPGW